MNSERDGIIDEQPKPDDTARLGDGDEQVTGNRERSAVDETAAQLGDFA